MPQLPDIGTIKSATIDGLSIRYATSGSAEGTPILLTSPWPESIYAFRDVLDYIRQLGPVIVVDIPGFGRSETRADVMAPEAMGRFILQFADHLGLGRLHAVGPDVGTSALLFAAHQAPDRFESIVCGSGGMSVDLCGPLLRDLVGSPRGHFAEVEGGAFVTGLLVKEAARPIPEAVLDDYRLSSAGNRFETATNYVRAFPTELPRLQTLLSSIQTPVLVIEGRNDAIVPPANGELVARSLRHSRQVLLDAGHLVWEDQADAYAEHLKSWLQGGYRAL